MHKPDRDWFIRATQNFDVELTEKRRTQLALRGELLYGKYCKLNGNGICAESFAEYHALRGEYVVVIDFLDFLNAQLDQPLNPTKLEITQQLIYRVEALLSEFVEAVY